MTCKFKTITDYGNKVFKDVATGWSEALTINSYEEVNDLTCDFLVTGTSLHGYNYMQVDWGGHTKYYFIEIRGGNKGGMTMVRGKCDVLTTYHNAIYNSPAVIGRTNNGSKINMYVRDDRIPITSLTAMSSKRLGNVINANSEEFIYMGVWQIGENSTASEVNP